MKDFYMSEITTSETGTSCLEFGDHERHYKLLMSESEETPSVHQFELRALNSPNDTFVTYSVETEETGKGPIFADGLMQAKEEMQNLRDTDYEFWKANEKGMQHLDSCLVETIAHFPYEASQSAEEDFTKAVENMQAEEPVMGK